MSLAIPSLDRLTGGFKPYALLSLFCLMLFAPGLADLPPMDRDESRFMQATRQMLETGDYIRIQFQGEMRAKKPAGAYWLQAGSVGALSHPASTQTWPYRLPSALAAWAAVLMTFAFGRALIGERPALVGAMLLAACTMLVSEAHQAKTDAIMLALVVAAQGLLARFYVAARAKDAAAPSGGGCGSASASPIKMPGTWEALAFWLVQGAAILVKGPVVPVISLLTIAALGLADRQVRWLVPMRPVLGTIVAAAIAAPWFAAVSQATGGAFVGEAVKGDLLPKLLGAHESHGGFPGQYLVLSVVLLWPGSLLLLPAASRMWGQRHRLAFRVLLAWAVPTWIMFELIPTKLPHYVLPAFPALALMGAALVIEGLDAFQTKWARAWYGVWCLVGLTLAGLVVALPIVLGGGFVWLSVPAALGIVLATLLPATLAWKGRLPEAALALGLTALATYPVLFQGVLPSLDRMFLSRGAAQMVKLVGSDGPVVSAGFSEPSLVFWLGTETKLADGSAAAAHLAANRRALAVVEDKQEAGFLGRAAELGLVIEEFGRIDGFNYSRGKRAALTVYGVKSP
ncbi:Glycosyl transferase, family 39 [Magnetospirillum sp. LM-5]|uniref:ArnT family glycosyltransferase n=1 Tax=Magnetospirillum sp. LM-5 TaxID=2681466 RepID=UPI00137CF596|nr:phospholipid carrier-dependent glycosyltransferase [Magnetospirillum sp. LM-5]CAA7620216.1 Glycosyl transferase, family 39 [Magnetospirillum sp. LM-5]